ncbi:MAG: peptide deformylase [Desulfobulbaceae bacterium]|jgi:peptide deformylase|nr:peptide deformylase [Desulfobulbaceae bacterium]HKJ14936.1 peptide deformylase [Desulfobulbales bacterium]MDH3542811.1 peptide deformylase [Desulfobulbaceae bacterium]MDH3776112.1 peptide deformylase [Desulfobulbaceae bacterium]MDH3782728.1 peptide deformylase [Desulfobulbaceae bacterium]
MAIKKILTFPNPVLRQKVETVTSFDESLKELATDLAETMYDAPGAGLAANQIGVCLRVVVVDVSENKEEKKHLVLVNPEIIDKEGCQIDEEGCLSVIDLTAKVERYRKLLVRAQDLDGKSWEFPAEDFFARVIQHELDHINGILFIDHLSSLKRTLYKKRLKKILREQEEGSF